MSLLYVLSTLLLAVIIVLCGGMILRAFVLPLFGPSRVEEIRRLRREGLAVHHEGES